MQVWFTSSNKPQGCKLLKCLNFGLGPKKIFILPAKLIFFLHRGAIPFRRPTPYAHSISVREKQTIYVEILKRQDKKQDSSKQGRNQGKDIKTENVSLSNRRWVLATLNIKEQAFYQ